MGDPEEQRGERPRADGTTRSRRRSRSERSQDAAAALGVRPERQPAVVAMVESSDMPSGRRLRAIIVCLVVALMAAPVVAILCLIVVMVVLREPPFAVELFCGLWIGGVGWIAVLVLRRTLSRERWEQATSRLNERACINCGSGVRGVLEDEAGVVRCPECGCQTPRSAGPPLIDHLVGRARLPVGATVFDEPRATLLGSTGARPEDVDGLTVALAERTPGLGNRALLAAIATLVILGGLSVIIVSVVVSAVWFGSAGGNGESALVVMSVMIAMTLGVGVVAWRVFRAIINPTWRRVTVTAVESGTCFKCAHPLEGATPEAGWRTCPECGFRSPGGRMESADEPAEVTGG